MKKKVDTPVVVFDWKEFSDTCFEQLETALKPLGIYTYNLEVAVYGEVVSDTYIIAFSRVKLNQKQLQGLGRENGLGEEELEEE